MVRPFRSSHPLALTLLALALVGCSGGHSNPAAPAATSNPIQAGPSLPGADLSTGKEQMGDGALPLMIEQGTLDWQTGTISMSPLESERTGSISPVGDDRRIVDVSPFLTNSPCVDCFRVKGLGLDPNGNIQVDFSLKHPFPDRTLRADLDVFDPIAIFLSTGPTAVTTTFNSLEAIDEDGNGTADNKPTGNMHLIANADGYTDRHDHLITTLFPSTNYPGNLNPFVSFFTENDPSPTGIGSDIGFHKFPQGPVVDTKRVTFYRPANGTNLKFLVVVSINYGQSATYANTFEDPSALGSRLNPVYFNPEYNMKEAYEVKADGGSGLEAGNPTSTTTVTAWVKDWQAGAAIDPNYPNFPNYTNRSGIKFRSDIDHLKLTVPAVSATTYSAILSDKKQGTGAPSDPYKFTWDVTNDLLVAPGTYSGLVEVVDQYQTDGRTLLGYTPSEIDTNFTQYQVVHVTVTTPACNNPIAVGSANPNTVDSGVDVTFDDTASTAPGSTITEYEWDFDNSGTWDYTSTTPANNVKHAYVNTTPSDIVMHAILRVTNACGSQNTDDVPVTVHGNSAPVASLTANPNPAQSGETVNLDASGSTDPDGDTMTYEWDFNYDGSNFNPVSGHTSPTDSTSYCNTTNGDLVHVAAVRVTDSHLASTIKSVNITVHGNRAPVAAMQAVPNPVDSGNNVDFTSTGTNDPDGSCGDSVATIEWDFDYQGSTFTVDATGPSVQHAYDNTGASDITFTAAMRATDTHGTISTVVTTVITVHPGATCTTPTAAQGTSNSSQVSGLPITFYASLSAPNGGTFTKYAWDWDIFDSTPPEEFAAVGGELPPVDHTYLFTGPGSSRNFTARLYVYTSDTCFDKTGPGADCQGDPSQCDAVVTITANTPPEASCGANPNPVTAGCEVTFSEAGSHDPDPTGSIIKYQWDWDDRDGVNWGTPDYESTTQGGARHTYTNVSGSDETFNATLRVIDNNGTFGTCQVPMTVHPNIAPTAAASADPNPVPFSGFTVNFIDSASTDPDSCGATTYIWDYDDSNGVDLSPSSADHVSTTPDTASTAYTNPGPGDIVKHATLRVLDGAGAYDDATVDITVGPPIHSPTVTFTEAKNCSSDGDTYTYKVMQPQSWVSISNFINGNAGAVYDLTDTTKWPLNGQTRTRRYDLPSAVPQVNLPGSSIIYSAATYAGPNYEGRNYSAGNPAQYIGVSDGAGNDFVYDTPLPFSYDETAEPPQHRAYHVSFYIESVGYTEDVDINVDITNFGLTKTYKGDWLTFVEYNTVIQSIPDLGYQVTQHEYTLVSDEGYIVGDFIEVLDAGGNTTNTGQGIVLSDYNDLP